MIDRSRLLSDLQSATADLVDDLRQRSEDVAAVRDRVRGQYEEAREAGRTDRSYEEWREDFLAQVAVGWVLGTVFVRFCEDNGLTPRPLLSGPGSRRDLARDHRANWLAHHPTEGDRGWLQEVFGRYQDLPATHDVFGEHNPLWQFGPTDDGARALLEVWWEVDVSSGELLRDFTDPELDTRFLGDLYQDLSDHAKDNYALLQTPEFVEEFILDRTLDPAIETFGLKEVKMIDPACGSGHFLLGAFERLLGHWRELEPATSDRELTQRTLTAIHGVDLNPFAVAIARFRLLVASLRASGIEKLSDAPDFHMNLAVGDSLLHGRRGESFLGGTEGHSPLLRHRYPTEDGASADRILQPSRYHAVVGNPPYITVKDAAVRTAYREMYHTASGKYSLGVPFTERFFDLAATSTSGCAAGYVGLITANSFMKRSFGRKLIKDFLPKVDLTHIIDTSGAYIPGHSTATVILFGRHRSPKGGKIRAVLGVRGELGTPKDPRHGKVWRSVVGMVDEPGAENEFLSVEDVPRSRYATHPWSLQGGAAPDVREVVERVGSRRLGERATAIGITAVTGEDNLFVHSADGLPPGLPIEEGIRLTVGEQVRDWSASRGYVAIWVYDDELEVKNFDELSDATRRLLWTAKPVISHRRRFGVPMLERGAVWWEWQELYTDKLRTPLTIFFAFVATHNHFVLDRRGKVFKQSVLVIKLPADATEDEHLRLLGLLNSSTACFWMKQVCQSKGGSGDNWEDRYEHDGTKLQQFPIPPSTPLERARSLDSLAREIERLSPASVLARESPSGEVLSRARDEVENLLPRMIALQEELDWECYHLYGLTDRNLALPMDEIPKLALGERAFEIALARAMKEGHKKSTWFSRHGSTPITELPPSWPDGYRERVEERLALIASDRKLRLLERPEYKRRWNWDDWEELQDEALRRWLLDRIEGLECWQEPELQTVGRLADHLRRDLAAVEAARLLAGRSDVDLADLVGSLVADEAVPHAGAFRFKKAGMRKRREWERVWELQRAEDEIDARTELPPDDPRHLSAAEADALRRERGVDRIPVPPKYRKGDFRDDTAWRLRGKLDVPKERFISYPDTRVGADGTLVVGWAGWDHLAQARALSGQYQRRKDDGAEPSELVPLLAGLDELVPWLLQWHNQLDPEWGSRMGDFFRAFVDTEARSLGLTRDDLMSWTP